MQLDFREDNLLVELKLLHSSVLQGGNMQKLGQLLTFRLRLMNQLAYGQRHSSG